MTNFDFKSFIIFALFFSWAIWQNIRFKAWYKNMWEAIRKTRCKYNWVSAITKSDMEDTLEKTGFPGAYMNLLDDKYYIFTEETYKNFLSIDQTDKRTGGIMYDCDDFAFRTMSEVRYAMPSAAFGVVLVEIVNPQGSKFHALNFFISFDRKMKLVEPQEDRIFDKPANYKPYFFLA
jgi:hypothetical protein